MLCCALALLALVPDVWVAPVVAQELEPSYRVRLASQPVWHRPTDPLNLRIRIHNDGDAPIQGFLLSLTAHPVVTTRSALHLSFEGSPGAVASAFSEQHDRDIAPGASASVVIDEPLASFSSLANISEDREGVYPLTVAVSDPTGVMQYGSFTTPLIVYPSPPEIPLNLSVALPLNALPSRGPDGSFRDPTGRGQIPLEEAVAEDGWLTGLVTALQAEAGELPPIETRERIRGRGRRARSSPRFRTVEVPQEGLRLALAPTPRFVEELADAGTGYRRLGEEGSESVATENPAATAARDLRRRLAALTGESGIQTLLVPYSFPDLPALVDHAPERIDLELDEAVDVIDTHLDLPLTREWLFPPAGRLGARALDEIRFNDGDTASHVLFHPAAFSEDPDTLDAGCPETFATFTCPAAVRTPRGATTGLVADQGLQDRFVHIVHRGDDQLDLQRFFAETAAIRQELPSIPDRVVHVTVPSLWHPSPRRWMDLLAGLRNAPWLNSVTPAEALELRDPVQRTADFTPDMPPLNTEPDPDFFDEVATTSELVERFRRMQPPEQLVTRLRRNTLVAQSRLWWPTFELFQNATNYLEATEVETETQISKVSVGGPAQINLTSQTGEIPLVISNGAAFATIVRVTIRSLQPDLSLTPTQIEPQRINANDAFQFTVQAASRSSGIFPVEVVVETPDGDLEIATKQITVRSTEFNRVALAVTLGAFAFLVFFYLLRLVRRRRPQAT